MISKRRISSLRMRMQIAGAFPLFPSPKIKIDMENKCNPLIVSPNLFSLVFTRITSATFDQESYMPSLMLCMDHLMNGWVYFYFHRTLVPT
jgi:hypothetical protein